MYLLHPCCLVDLIQPTLAKVPFAEWNDTPGGQRAAGCGFLAPNVIRDSGILALASVKSLGASGEMATSGMITPEQGLRYGMSLKLAKNSFFQASAGL